MTGSQIVIKLYFGIVVPLLGGLAVAYGSYELLGLSFFVALAVGGLFGHAAYFTSPQNAPPLTWQETRISVVWGTLLYAFIAAATWGAFVLSERHGSLPTLVVSAVTALATTQLAAALLRGGEGNRPKIVDIVLRGEGRGGNAEHARQLRDKEAHRVQKARQHRGG